MQPWPPEPVAFELCFQPAQAAVAEIGKILADRATRTRRWGVFTSQFSNAFVWRGILGWMFLLAARRMNYGVHRMRGAPLPALWLTLLLCAELRPPNQRSRLPSPLRDARVRWSAVGTP